MVIKKCRENISVLVKKVLEYRPGLCSESYPQKMFFLEVLKRLKLLKILQKVLLNTWSSTWYFIFKQILPVFFSVFFQDLELPRSFFLDRLLKSFSGHFGAWKQKKSWWYIFITNKNNEKTKKKQTCGISNKTRKHKHLV